MRQCTSVPFYAVVSGRDERGNRYRRQWPTLFRPQSVEVMADPVTDSGALPIEVRTDLTFKVRNLGGPDTFRIDSVAVGAKFLPIRATRVFPSELVLGRGEVGAFRVPLLLSAENAEGTPFDVVAVATSTDDATRTNSAVLRFTASRSANLIPQADAGDDIVANQGSTVVLDGSRSRDPDEGPAPLGFDWVQVAGPETSLAGATSVNPTFIPLAEGAYTFALSVRDGATMSLPDEVTVIAPEEPD